MTARANEERRFIDAADGLEFGARDPSGRFDAFEAFDAWLAERETSLREARLGADGLHEGSALAMQGAAVDAALQAAAQACAQPWTRIEAARSLAGQFEDRAMLLVFGKFNAGKSSFCNFLADRFAAHGRAVRYFRVEAGRLVAGAGRFREGETETTAQLQGVYLGARLVLLDTPGLHSVTPDNAALTRRFVESADGVIWLTSSASPGQVQELDDLGLELHRGKPLLPVLTRSDEYEEDERDGRLVRRLANKSTARRALQEADVTARAADKLAALGVDAALLAAPVSVSVRMAREPAADAAGGETERTPDSEALAAAGFERLYAALHAMGGPALAYKRRKHAEVALHHLDENLSRALRDELRPLLARLATLVHEAAGRLDAQQAQLRREIVRRVLPALPGALDAHAAARDVPALCRSVAEMLDAALRDAIPARFGDYLIVPGTAAASGARIELHDGTGYEARVVGDAGERIEVDYQRLYAALREAVLERATLAADRAAGQARAAIARLLERARWLDEVLEQGARRLDALGRELRAAPAPAGPAAR
ncbi:GTPase [Burkholderia plantarii]|uniref:GTPase n=1 Tax=Burkholderia plantarii TaxID=41899 RepID=UPI0018DEC8B0|nr:GTPase [Burkholderia plantarii]MBI0331806.1 50S ribosome-binding GTPase [Burkholderia plantarii]